MICLKTQTDAGKSYCLFQVVESRKKVETKKQESQVLLIQRPETGAHGPALLDINGQRPKTCAHGPAPSRHQWHQ